MLDGKVVLVTGGSGALGSSFCRTFARYGADVAFTFHRNEDRARALALEIEGLGRRCAFERVAGCDGKAVEAFCARLEQQFERIDGLVNCIGVVQVMPFALIDEEDWDSALSVNLKPMFLFSKAVVRGMIRRRAGVIVNVGSVAGHRMLEVPVHYATAKAAVVGFTVSLAKELARYRIRVNTIVPGLLQGGVGMNVSERQMAEYERYCATGRAGLPDEVAEACAFLLSDRSSYLNAQSVVVDGGL
jgi:3-oxoacyl-[acyl-carrier protein] reductase